MNAEMALNCWETRQLRTEKAEEFNAGNTELLSSASMQALVEGNPISCCCPEGWNNAHPSKSKNENHRAKVHCS